MAIVAKVTSDGWEQWDTSVAVSRVTADGWSQVITLDVNAALSGSALTVGHGIQSPVFSIPL